LAKQILHIESADYPAEWLQNKVRVLSNTVVQVIGLVFNVLSGLVITAMLARYLGAKGFGELNLILLYFSFVGIVVNFGYKSIIVRELSRKGGKEEHNESAIITSGFLLQLTSAIVAISGLVLYLSAKDYPVELKFQILLLSCAHFADIFMVFDSVFRARLQMVYSVYTTIGHRLVHLVIVLFCIYFKLSLTQIVCTYWLSILSKVALSYFLGRRLINYHFRWDLNEIKFILKKSFLLGLSGGLWILYYRIDTFMLDWLKGVEAVGMYSAAFRFVDYAFLLSGLVMTSIYPLMAERHPDNPIGLQRIYQKTLNYLAIIGGGISLVFFIGAPYAIYFIFGENYAPVIPALQVFGFIPLLIFLNNACGHMLLVLGLQGKSLLSMRVWGVVMNIGMNIIMIPRYGYYGAAITTVITEFVLLMVALGIIRGKMSFMPSLKNLALNLTLSIVFFILVVSQVKTVFKLIVPPVVFMLVNACFCDFDKRELWATLSLWKKKKEI